MTEAPNKPGNAADAAPNGPIQLRFTSTPRSLPVVRAAVERLALEIGFNATDAHSVSWAVDEALTNVIRHGYRHALDQPIDVSLEPGCRDDGVAGLRITIRDAGRQVDPCTIKGRPLTEIRPGGLGVHVIQSVMDEVEYSCPAEGGMMLRMVKHNVPRAAPETAAPVESG